MIFWIPLTDLGKNVLTVTLASKVEPQLSKVSSIYLKAMNKEGIYISNDREKLL